MSDGAPFVAREPELVRLQAHLDRALAGQGQICLITGGAGSGKSALVAEFVRQAQAAHPDLLLAVGLCDPHVGGGMPYAPFREVIEDFTDAASPRGVPAKVATENSSRLRRGLAVAIDTVINFGPDLVETVVPGTNLAVKIGKYFAEKLGWRDKLSERIAKSRKEQKLVSAAPPPADQIPEQYVNILRAFAERAPLLIVLEDLHWADGASCDLLARLSRRLGDRRMLVVGTVREHDLRGRQPDDPHPLAFILDEIKRSHGDVFIDLDRARLERARAFVNELIDAEPNRLDEGFRANLLQHTDGHPLFTVELLNELKLRRELDKDAQGCWCAVAAIDWAKLPAKVEGVIEARIRATTASEQERLNAASVEGVQFTAEVIARVSGADPRAVVRELSGDLQGKHQLVESRATLRVGQQRVSVYAFAHGLFQRYLYGRLDAAERSYLHESVGLALEALYGGRVGEIAPQLARHFDQAGLADKARAYLRLSAEQAALAHANDAALEYFSRALALTATDDAAERYALIAGRERILDMLGRREEQRRDQAELGRLVDALPDPPRRRAELMLRRAKLALDVSKYEAALDEAGQVLRMSASDGSLGDAAPLLRLDALLMCARVHGRRGAPAQSAQHLEEALAICDRHGFTEARRHVLAMLGDMAWALGDLAKAADHLEQALGLAVDARDLFREWNVRNTLGIIAGDRRDFARALDHFERARAITRQLGDRLGETRVLCNLSNCYLSVCDYDRARDTAAGALDLASDVSERNLQTVALINLGESRLEAGSHAEAGAHFARALALASAIGFLRAQASSLEDIGRVALALGDAATAVERIERAVEIAESIGSRFRIGSASFNLGRACMARGALDTSAAAFARALDVWRALGSAANELQARAGLAEVELARGGDGAARRAAAHLADAADALAADRPPDWLRYAPMFAPAACEAVLRALGDPRAERVRDAALREVSRRAAAITDEHARRTYLASAIPGP